MPDLPLATREASALLPAERSRLAELEAVVERGLQTFIEVGLALKEIRDSRLYRETHKTFEGYLDERWSMSRSRGYRLIDGARVAELVSPMGDISNERQARELVPLFEDEAELVDVWRELKAEHGDRVTAEKVRTAVRQRLKYGDVDTWPGSSHARLLRECLRRGEAADGTPLDRMNESGRRTWRMVYWCMKASESDYTAATNMWEAGQLLLEHPDWKSEFRSDRRGAADGAVRIARRFPTRLTLQLAIDALEEDPGFVSWQQLARWAA